MLGGLTNSASLSFSSFASVNQKGKLILPFSSSITWSSSGDAHALNFHFLRRNFAGKWTGSRGRSSSSHVFPVFCQSATEEIQLRKCSPFLESSSLLYNDATVSDEWQAVPDIWRYSSEKYGDRVALVDPYHDPPTNMTYKQIRGVSKKCLLDFHDDGIKSVQLEQEILEFSEGLRAIGVNPNEKVALFSDNSCRWLVADQGIMTTGAINVVRGSRSSTDELLQIYNHSESVALAVDSPELFNRIAERFFSEASPKFIILLWGEKSSLAREPVKGIPVFGYNEIIGLGQESRKTMFDSRDARQQHVYEAINSDDIATLVYTSGTTGNPKGVMLTHRNLLHQIRNLHDVVPAEPGDRFLCMLPPWHAYERACEYFTLTHGIEQVYTTVKNLKDDLRQYQPHYLISVPLVYETLYSGIQKQIATSSSARRLLALTFIKISLMYMELKRIYEGTYLSAQQKQPSYIFSTWDCIRARIVATILLPVHTLAKSIVYSKIQSAIGIWKAGISGGGSLPAHVDRFYEAIGIKVQNGYGLTESSPVISARRPTCNVLGSVGHPIRYTEFRVVDVETGEVLPHGSKGIVEVRGPQVMKGYYKNPSATERVLDSAGWLRTGDIGWIAPHHSRGRSRHCGGVIVLDGRAKDTIVLSTGENVEPEELEGAALRSSLIQQIVVIGQDQRRLGAIIVPNKEEAILAAKKLSIIDSSSSELNKESLTSLIYKELRTWTSGFSFQIGPILIVDEAFTIDSGLMTPTMKIRRDKVVSLYKEQIDNLFK